MCRHIVVSFVYMFKIRSPIRHDSVEEGCKVQTDVGIGILIDCQCSRSMLDKKGSASRFPATEGDETKALGLSNDTLSRNAVILSPLS